jgi:hypothetical protein
MYSSTNNASSYFYKPNKYYYFYKNDDNENPINRCPCSNSMLRLDEEKLRPTSISSSYSSNTFLPSIQTITRDVNLSNLKNQAVSSSPISMSTTSSSSNTSATVISPLLNRSRHKMSNFIYDGDKSILNDSNSFRPIERQTKLHHIDPTKSLNLSSSTTNTTTPSTPSTGSSESARSFRLFNSNLAYPSLAKKKHFTSTLNINIANSSDYKRGNFKTTLDHFNSNKTIYINEANNRQRTGTLANNAKRLSTSNFNLSTVGNSFARSSSLTRIKSTFNKDIQLKISPIRLSNYGM